MSLVATPKLMLLFDINRKETANMLVSSAQGDHAAVCGSCWQQVETWRTLSRAARGDLSAKSVHVLQNATDAAHMLHAAKAHMDAPPAASKRTVECRTVDGDTLSYVRDLVQDCRRLGITAEVPAPDDTANPCRTERFADAGFPQMLVQEADLASMYDGKLTAMTEIPVDAKHLCHVVHAIDTAIDATTAARACPIATWQAARTAAHATTRQQLAAAAVAAQQQQRSRRNAAPAAAALLTPTATALLCAGLDLVYRGEQALNRDATKHLLLLAATEPGMGTGLHIDPGGAKNVAFPYQQAPAAGAVLATWLFISPAVFRNLPLLRKLITVATAHWDCREQLECLQPAAGADLTEDKQLSGLEDLLNKQTFTPACMRALQAALPECVFVVEQCAGDVVIVFPGWAHAVYNNNPCVKVAVEVLPFDQVVPALQMQHALRCFVSAGVAPQDYMYIHANVVEHAAQWAKHLRER